MKILGLISSPIDPASRTRIIQYQKYFAKRNVKLTSRYFRPLKEDGPARWMHVLKKLTSVSEWRISNITKTINRLPLLIQQAGYDVIWQNRLMLNHHSGLETLLKKPAVFDFDDAIWLIEGKHHVTRVMRRSAMIFAGNAYLADFASSYNARVHVVPTTVDTETLYPLKTKRDYFTIGWVGTESNFCYLELVKPAILEFLEKNKDCKFVIISSTPPMLFRFDDKRIVFRKWEPGIENELINSLDVGLMPLTDDEWTRGKCSYKMLQYMACGKPLMASPVGTNIELLKKQTIGLSAVSADEWLNGFYALKNDNSFYRLCAENGRSVVEKEYSCRVWCEKIIDLFGEVCSFKNK